LIVYFSEVMMARSWTLVAAPLVTTLVLGGCATKGQLHQVQAQMENQRATLEQALSQERSARAAADEQQAAQLQQLRADLQALRTEFGAKITALEEGLKFDMPVHFAFDDANVRPEDFAALNRFTDIVNKYYPGSVITVEGFADPAGTRAYNARLSEHRAEAVRDHLVDRGITAQLRTVGYGEERQVTPGASKDQPGAQLNRRVVFVIESTTAPNITAMAQTTS